jgi:hypothetical protein
MVLLRTAEITNVDDRRSPTDEDATVPARRTRQTTSARPELRQYGLRVDGLPYVASPPPRLRVVEDVGSEQTITLSLPTKRTAGVKHPASRKSGA